MNSASTTLIWYEDKVGQWKLKALTLRLIPVAICNLIDFETVGAIQALLYHWNIGLGHLPTGPVTRLGDSSLKRPLKFARTSDDLQMHICHLRSA